jgi:hypothetical protein
MSDAGSIEPPSSIDGGALPLPCSECDGDTPYCQAASGRCVECTLIEHCEADEVCDALSGSCVEACEDDVDCESEDSETCHPSRLICVECLSDEDCEPEERASCSASGRCAECATH